MRATATRVQTRTSAYIEFQLGESVLDMIIGVRNELTLPKFRDEGMEFLDFACCLLRTQGLDFS